MLPFIVSLGHRHELDHACREQTQITQLIHRMGASLTILAERSVATSL
jgi:hypothetical protein